MFSKLFSKNKKEPLVRVRFAPSPTGPLHIGGARTALFNYLFARKHNGQFVLRIEDTDKERSELQWVTEIIDGLHWLSVNWNEGPDVGGACGPYKQSQKTDVYKKYLEQLLTEKKAYFCTCSPEDLEAKRQDQLSRGLAPKYDGTCRDKHNTTGVIRFKVANKKVKFHDLIRSDVEFDMGLLGDIVIAKNSDTPLFHLTVIIDDFEMKISHVIRGEEHLANTARQILLQEALGFTRPIYAHIPLFLNADKSKMSKRQGDVALKDYINNGYLPEAIINFIVFLGWNPGGEREIYSLKELEKEFSLEKVQKAGAVFNVKKLDSINSYYIREKSAETLAKLCQPFLEKAGLLKGEVSEKMLQKTVEAYKARMKKLSDIIELADFLFAEKLVYEKNMLLWKEMGDSEVVKALDYAKKVIETAEYSDIKQLEAALIAAAEQFNIENNYPKENKGYLLWPLRVALSGKQASASPFEIIDILGKEKSLKRIEEAKELLSH